METPIRWRFRRRRRRSRPWSVTCGGRGESGHGFGWEMRQGLCEKQDMGQVKRSGAFESQSLCDKGVTGLPLQFVQRDQIYLTKTNLFPQKTQK